MKTNSLESSLIETRDSFTQACGQYTKQYQDQIHQAPITNVACAVAAGYLLHFLPVRGVLTAVIRIAVSLIQPAIFLFGAVKLVSFLGQEGERLDSKNAGRSKKEDPA